MKAEDVQYTTDQTAMQNLGIWDIGAVYWLESRKVYKTGQDSCFFVCMSSLSFTSGFSSVVWISIDEGEEGRNLSYGFRPVFKLKSGLKVIAGNGTLTAPYELST